MHKTVFALALALSLSTPALLADDTAGSTPATPPADTTPVPAPAPLTAEQKTKVLESLGWFIAQGPSQPLNLEQFGFTSEELDVLLRGIRNGAEGQDKMADFQAIIPLLNPFLSEKAQAYAPKLAARTQARQQEWLKKNGDYLRNIDKEEGVEQTPSGLRYKVLTKGAGPVPTATSTVKAKYSGKLVDGHVFDSTELQGGEPASFPLNGVIRGWTEGLQKIGKGGKIILYVPSELGYGEQGSPGNIPPHSTLIFEVELVDVVNAQPAPAADTPATTPAPAAQ